MDDFLIGHYDDGITGTSVVMCLEGAVGGVDVRGGAPGTRETDLFKNEKTVNAINAVVLTGGSAFGLDACSGVVKYLSERGSGFSAGIHRVPIVAGAVLFDLNGSELRYPTQEFGYKACQNAIINNPLRGNVGAGTGATIGKIAGADFASKGGIGIGEVFIGDVCVRAMIALNALGDVYDLNGGKIIAGAKTKDGKFLDTNSFLLNVPKIPTEQEGKNTTIGIIMTDAELSKVQANMLASCAHNGLAQSIRPVHTPFDGDSLFVLAKGGKRAEFVSLCVGAVEAVRLAVLNAVG